MTSPRHVHTPVEDKAGRQICSQCSMVVWKPILSSDDDRLQGAGLMRSQHHDIDEAIDYPPLPELLIALFYNGPSIGLPRAPAAHYIHIVAQEEGRRSESGEYRNPDDIWQNLYKRWILHVKSSQDTNKR